MNHEYFMWEALKESDIALKEWNRPFAAVLVRNDEIIWREHNKVLTSNDPTAHAELDLIKKVCKKYQTDDLSDCILYATCEPCPMCAAAIVWANIWTIVYGCDNYEWPSNYKRQNDLTCVEVVKKSGQDIKIIKHILREECKNTFK